MLDGGQAQSFLLGILLKNILGFSVENPYFIEGCVFMEERVNLFECGYEEVDLDLVDLDEVLLAFMRSEELERISLSWVKYGVLTELSKIRLS